MADSRISELTALAGASIAADDEFVVVDVSDSTMAASGTDKKTTTTDIATAVSTLLSLASTYQPLDSDLTAIAALTTTSFGRGLLALADAAALRTSAGVVIGTDVEAHDADLTAIAGLTPTNDDVLQRKAGAWTNRTIAQLASDLGLSSTYQPLDSDLTAIAALTTTSFGRAFLALADAAAARTAIGVVIGTDVQAYDADLAALAGLTSAADTLPYFTGSGTAATTSFTSAGRALVDDADAAAQRTTLGLGTMATQASSSYLPLAAGGASVENLGAVESNVNTVATTGATETLDTSLYAVHDCTMDQACTFTFSNPAPSGKNTTFMLILRGAFTPTFPASVDWPDGAAPTYTTPTAYVFTTVDAGTTWLGQSIGKAFA